MGHGVNLVTGDYSVGASGLWIENGELAYPVEQITIAGNLKDIFRNVVAIGNDLEFRALRRGANRARRWYDRRRQLTAQPFENPAPRPESRNPSKIQSVAAPFAFDHRAEFLPESSDDLLRSIPAAPGVFAPARS